MNTEIEKIHNYWFGTVEDGTTLEKRNRLWFGGEKSTDDYIRTHFESQVLKAKQGSLDAWKETPRGSLCLIILLDQFPLNMYRKSARAYEFENAGIEVCLSGIKKGQHEQLSFIEKTFFYLPLEHSENTDHQDKSVKMFTELWKYAPSHLKEHGKTVLRYAEKHRDIVQKFGRFPHRNEVLGRTSSPEEIEFLEDASNRFGQ